MGTGQINPDTQTRLDTKPPRCSVCRQTISADCTWRQGRCPHRPSMLDQILQDPYRSRFYRLLNFFRGTK